MQRCYYRPNGRTLRSESPLRGITLMGVATLVAEIDDLSRFENTKQLMGRFGLV